MSGKAWKYKLLQDLVVCTATPLLAYFIMQKLLARMPDSEASVRAEKEQKQAKAARRIESILADRHTQEDSDSDADSDSDQTSKRSRTFERPRIADLNLTSYEQSIATEVILPSDIPVSFSDIGGLDAIISDLQESVIYPLTLPHLYASSPLLGAPSGVLLHGPPGCGKTMLAKALAHESGACFINLHISTLTEKWYGDSNKLTAAVFSLARKLAPSIVFVDEIDAVLGTRHSGEHEASGMVKAEFMTHWDGLASSEVGTRTPQRVVILGATNRMHDIDDAILRRMPKKFAVGLPNAAQRRRIYALILKDMKIDDSADESGTQRQLDWDYIVRASYGMSGSEIKEACREAALVPFRDFVREKKASGASLSKVKPQDVRGLRTEDFFKDVLRPMAAPVAKEAEDDGFETTSEGSS